MNPVWAIRLALANRAALAVLRQRKDIEVAEEPNAVWVRGYKFDAKLDLILKGLPADARYDCLPDGNLRPMGERIPSGPLPDLSWQSIESWFEVALPPICEVSNTPLYRIPLRLIPSVCEQVPQLLMTDFDLWRNYAEEAPEIRLQCLTFAVRQDGQVLIRGTPLPPLPGRRWILTGGIAVPAGWTWSPAVDLDVIEQWAQASPESLILWHETNVLVRLHLDQFLPATRSHVRASACGEPQAP